MAIRTLRIHRAPMTLGDAAAPAARRAAGLAARARAFSELTKPGITAFVVVVAGASFQAASPAGTLLLPLLHALFGTALCTGGALALNQYAERDVDAIMERTRARPLPSGRLTAKEALLFGALLVLGGIAYLTATVGALPAAVGAASAVLYIFVYTPLKRRSAVSTLVGAVPGSLPTLIGWGAASGSLDPGAWVLFAILYLWQLPHVLAISWLLRDDYRRAGFHMVPVLDRDGVRTGPHVVLYAAALLPVSLLPALLGLAGPLYFFGALTLGLLLLAAGAPAARRMTDALARRVFFGSLIYLPALLTLLALSTLKR
ncbi:MAG: protoheme IX farnesyltransferase [Gemmatimonadetes bacterium]|nr:protoheme IX farnesyltransferase [Gemmatimonadota bacterium]